jgi:hypothetical protein
MSEPMMAVCGLDCSGCPLLKASFGDLQAAEHLAEWWKSAGWLSEDQGPEDVIAGGPHCLGCLGDRTRHWSSNCWILQCAVDERGLDSCHQCDDFPCTRLVAWAAQNDGYAAALDRLRQMKADAA